VVERNTTTPILIITTFIILIITTTKIILKHSHNLKDTKNSLTAAFIISLIPLSALLNNENEIIVSSPTIINTTTININMTFILDYPSLTFIPIALFVT